PLFVPARLISSFTFLFVSTLPRPLRSTLFPYTTLFRSQCRPRRAGRERLCRLEARRRHHQPGHQRRARLLKPALDRPRRRAAQADRKSTRLNSSHVSISYAVFCLKKKK